MRFDLLMRGGHLIDGSGAPARMADLAVRGDRIADIGDLSGASATEVVDLSRSTGCPLIVCPGFIDVHSHSDTYILLNPEAEAKLRQGVTTEICGNCGASCTPVTHYDQWPSDWAARDYGTLQWHTLTDYRAVLASIKPAVNISMLTGHNTLLRRMKSNPIETDGSNLTDSMIRLLEEELDAGSVGFSTGLEYPPGMLAPLEEINALAAVAARRERIYTTHMRNEGDRVIEALEEALAVARATGVSLQLSHLKVLHARNWKRIDDLLERLDAAEHSGLDVAADAYPYTVCATDIDVMLPAWFHDGGRCASLARLRDPDVCRRLLAHLRCDVGPDVLAGVTVAGTVSAAANRFQGLRLTAVAESLSLDPAEAVLELCRLDALRTGAFFEGIDEAGMLRVLARSDVAIGSDASLRTLDGPLHIGYPHPRTFGAFPRYLRTVMEGRLGIDLPEAIRKVTALPAHRFKLKRRGCLRSGFAADIVVFDPGRISDKATFEHPWQYAEGVEFVVVNGVMSIAGGRLTGRRGGQFVSP